MARDPRRRMRQVPTFAKANETVLAIHAESWKSERTEGQWRASMRDYVLPRLARKRVDAVTTADVMAVLLPIWSSKRVIAGRVRQRIGAVMKWAVAQGYRDDNPAGDAISAALPNTAVRQQHMRALPHAEVGAALARMKGSGAYLGTMLAFEFLVLTAARSGEVRNARWEQIDRDGAVWTIPAERMKTGREHRVPLSPRTLAVLDGAAELFGGQGLVFPYPGDHPIRIPTRSCASRCAGRRATSSLPTSRGWASSSTSRRCARASLHDRRAAAPGDVPDAARLEQREDHHRARRVSAERQRRPEKCAPRLP